MANDAQNKAVHANLTPQQKGMHEDATNRARSQGAKVTKEGHVELFHGTSEKKAPKEGDKWRVGTYFTTNHKIAEQYARAASSDKDKPKIMKVHIPAHKVFAGKTKDDYWSLNESHEVKSASSREDSLGRRK